MFVPSRSLLTACIIRTTAGSDLLENLKNSKPIKGTGPGRYHGSECTEILLLISKASFFHFSHYVFSFLLNKLVHVRLIYSPTDV